MFSNVIINQKFNFKIKKYQDHMYNMDLQLNGSQINLATRDKRPTPAVQYPANQRPGSANVATTINRTSLSLRGRPRRPQSADTFVLRNNSRNGLNFLSENYSEKLKLKRPLSSSSNLLNILLSEQIKRTWSTPDQDINSDSSLGQKIKSRASSQMDLHSDMADASSVEEDLNFTDTHQDDNIMYRNGLRKQIKKSEKLSPKPRFTVNSSKREGICHTDSGKKFVTFGNTHFAESQSMSGRSVTSGSDNNQEKPDLPGRVSFSKNDVYEIDYSDYENEDDALYHGSTSSANTVSASKSGNSSMNLGKNLEKPHKDIHPNEPQSFCCSLKCNSMGCSIDERDNSSFNKIYENSHQDVNQKESNTVINYYRKEVASLNRKHETVIAEKEEPFDCVPSVRHNVPKLQITHFNDDNTNPEDNTNHADKSSFNSNKSLKLENLKPLNNNGIAERHSKSDATSNAIIDNYLKTTNQSQVCIRDTSKQNNLSKTQKSKNFAKETKQSVPVFEKTFSKAKMKSGENLEEFQIDKVESWMSIHEKSFSNGKRELAEGGSYNNEWRDTPNSKTEDEGNFSFEDQIDDISNEESNYDEIVSVIKEIDDEKNRDLEAIKHTDLSASSSLQLRTSARPSTPDKMTEILSYLDNVDSSCIKTMQETFSYKIPDSFRSDIEFAVEPDVIGDMPKIADLVVLPNHQLARRIVALSLRANELSNAIQLSKEHIQHVRAEKQKAIRLEKQNSQFRLTEQKNHFEGVVTRHQGFIEQLLKDKALLCEKVSTLTRRIESQNQAWEHKLQTEIVRVKESTLAGEKIRRERWVRENTKKIKELTVKGLEDEINKMTCNHQKEITELKRQHQQDILDVVEKTRQKHDTIEMGIRDTYAQDRESAIEKERKAIRERFERQMTFEQRSFQEEKSKMMTEFIHEKDRMYSDFKEKEQEFERRREEYIYEKNEEIHCLKKEFREKALLSEKKHQADLASVREQFESDFLIWRREHEAAFKLREVEKENSVRNQCRTERDKQIDEIVAKVDSEALKTQQDFECKLLRLKDKYEKDLQNLEQTERCTREKYNETRTKLAESEANKQNMQSTVKQLELQLNHLQKMCDEFLRDKENMKENARREIEIEISNLKKERDKEIERIYARVQQAIEKKDATADMLQKENGALKERCIKLEAVIRQQRKDYCTK